jgi:hypothetical protein
MHIHLLLYGRLSAFANMRKAIICFVVFLCWTKFLEILPSVYNVYKCDTARQVTDNNAIFDPVIQQSQKYKFIYLK